jgi:hypothetical protein
MIPIIASPFSYLSVWFTIKPLGADCDDVDDHGEIAIRYQFHPDDRLNNQQ